MKLIVFKGPSIGYPVGEDISGAIASAKRFGETFNQVKEFKGKFVNIWCRGSSGAILAALLASNIKNECIVCHVKKDGETSHNREINPNRYVPFINVIIDDFVCSGRTIKSIYHHMQNEVEGMFGPTVDCLLIHNWSGMGENEVESYIGFIPSVLITNTQWG